MLIRYKVWIESETKEVYFGEGRQRLLRLIDEHGSIQQAAKLMGMSYRTAWGMLRASEQRFGFQLVEKTRGGKNKGTKLTYCGRCVLDWFDKLEKDIQKNVQKKSKEFESLCEKIPKPSGQKK